MRRWAAILTSLLSTPIRPASGTTVYLRDIATIENGTDIITAYAHVNGKTDGIHSRDEACGRFDLGGHRTRQGRHTKNSRQPFPKMSMYGWNSISRVTLPAAIRGLATEGLLGAILTGLMVLLFLRDWRSALIVVAEYPLRAVRRGGRCCGLPARRSTS